MPSFLFIRAYKGAAMIIYKISERNIIFTHKTGVWDLHLHLIIGEKKNYLIDTGLGAGHARTVLQYLKSVENLNSVVAINSHSDWDHVFGNAVFRDGQIVAHRNAYTPIRDNWEKEIEANAGFLTENPEMVLPNLLFDSELCFPEDDIFLLFSPGHTDDSIAVFDAKEKVLNVGDSIGDTDDNIIPEINTEFGMPVFIESIERCKALDAVLVVSGHNHIHGKDVFDKILSAAAPWRGNRNNA